MSDNYSALDLSQYDDTATSDYFTKTSNAMHDSADMDDTADSAADSHEVTSRRQQPCKVSTICRYVRVDCDQAT